MPESTRGSDSAGERMERQEMQVRLDHEVRTLPEEQRDAILLHYYEGFSQKETAEALGVSETTAK